MNAADLIPLQASLGIVQDGVAGVATYAELLHTIGCPLAVRSGIAGGLTDHLDAFGINTRLRVVHFLAQASHETEGFKFLTELGGAAYCAKYDGRRDLGNTQPGDGYRYRGRGLFQITGRANYHAIGGKLGLDLEGNPDQASQPDIAVWTACLYWRDHGLNDLADANDLVGITRKINGGLNGLDDRQAKLREIKAVWP